MPAATTIAISGLTLLAALVLIPSTPAGGRSRENRISRFGEYRGYCEASYDGYVRRSSYLPLTDGTKLAYDLLLPTRHGVPAERPLPVLLIHTPYLRVVKVVDDGRVLGGELFGLSRIQRAYLWLRAKLTKDGHLLDMVFRVPWLEPMLHHGYAVVAVERAGTGASSGIVHPSFELVAREAGQILDWIAAQTWSNGRIGMFGASYAAMTQYAAASAGNPHLKAILPTASSFDFYGGLFYRGGVFNTGFTSVMAYATAVLEEMTVPVDDDEGGRELARIRKERGRRTLGKASSEAFRSARFRDSERDEGPRIWEETSLYALLDRINRSGVAIYNSNAWHDIFTRDVFLWHENLQVPRLLHVRPLHHRDVDKSGADLDFGAEAHRWFDYWLKDIPNGIMDEPAVRYYVMGAPGHAAWRSAAAWPLPHQRPTRFYLAAGRSGSVPSTNDGSLRLDAPRTHRQRDAYTVSYTTTSGVNSRWNAIMGSGATHDMRSNDRQALTYTTDTLDKDVEITGHAVVRLWIQTEAPDVDLFVYLEEVDPAGGSLYVTEGNLRASHRAQTDPPFDNLGLPYHRGFESDVQKIPPGEPIELVFDLLPTSRIFERGKRIRIAITGADVDNFETPILEPPPEIQILRDPVHASYVDLPLITGSDAATSDRGTVSGQAVPDPTREVGRLVRSLGGRVDERAPL